MAATENQVLSVYCDESETLHCARCQTTLQIQDVAMLIRATPTEGFSSWCPRCTLLITFHAARDLGFVDMDVAT